GGQRDGERTGRAQVQRAGHRRRRGPGHRHGEGRGGRRPLPDDEGQAGRSPTRRGRPDQGMKPPFSLLVVHGDGSRVLRVSLPRWIVYGTLGSVAAVAAVGLSAEYVFRQRDGNEVAELRRRVDDQRAVIDSLQTRVAAVRGEITTWGALHAQMREAFGPEAGADQGGAGGGGGERRRGERRGGLRQARHARSRQRRAVALWPPEEARREGRPAGGEGAGHRARREHRPEHGAPPPLRGPHGGQAGRPEPVPLGALEFVNESPDRLGRITHVLLDGTVLERRARG